MGFLNPFSLLLLALIPVIWFWHVRRRARRAHPVSNLFLWVQGPSESRPSLFRRLRVTEDLMVGLAALLLLILAVSGPFVRFDRSKTSEIALVFDPSASMSAVERDRSRFDLAKEQAMQLIVQLHAGSRVLLIVAKPQPELAGDFRGNLDDALRAVRDLQPIDGSSNLAGGTELALSLMEAPAKGLLYILSDWTEASGMARTSFPSNTHCFGFGESDDNVAITQFAVRRDPRGLSDWELFCEVVNYSGRSKGAALIFALNDVLVHREEMALEPREHRKLVLAGTGREGDTIAARLEVSDALASDNEAFSVLRALHRRIVVEGRTPELLNAALRLIPGVELEYADPVHDLQHDQTAFDVVVKSEDDSSGVEANSELVLVDSSGGAGVSREIPRIPAISADHPVLRHLTGDYIPLADTALPPVSSEEVILLQSGHGPLLSLQSNGNLRRAKLSRSLCDGGFALGPPFPILVSSLLKWLVPDDGLSAEFKAGEPRSIRVRGGAGSRMVVTGPGDSEIRTMTTGGTGPYTLGSVPDRIGIYRIETDESAVLFAVNLLDEAESDIRPVSPSQAAHRDPPIPPRLSAHAAGQYSISPGLLVTALLLLMVRMLRRRGGEFE